MERVRRGDLGGLAALFERYHRSLFQFFVHLSSNRDLSQDLVQEVFLRVLKYRDSFQPDGSFTAWMYQIARNAHTDTMRKRRFEVIPGGADAKEIEMPANDEAADARLGRKQEVKLLRKALDRLPAEKRELLVLSRFQNLKYEEIAAILGVEVGTVKVRVYRAVRALSQIYFELEGEKAS
jgi:RNA polymerase sigma-70 factor (ECF subfamily)